MKPFLVKRGLLFVTSGKMTLGQVMVKGREVMSTPCVGQSGWPLYYTRSTGAESHGVVVGPSPRGADYLALEYERDGKTITHDCASLEKIRFDTHRSSQ